FVIGAKLGSFAQQSACAAGGYFFRFAGKSNQKGATSLEEAIFFYTGTAVVTIGTVPFPTTYCGGVRERHRCAACRGEACRGVGNSGQSPTYRALSSGANRKDGAATIADAHCAAMRCVSRRGGRCGNGGCALTVQDYPRYHNNLRRGRCPHRPCFWNSSTIVLNHRTRTAQVRRVPSSASALCASGHATACRTIQRRARCGWASPNSGCHPPIPTVRT
ncbi:MAG: hypothetical protein LBO63_03985, partial [Oscillospiraceae bacterium]|nr:hypothetical protein [Oscillospiraceae bacterium]